MCGHDPERVSVKPDFKMRSIRAKSYGKIASARRHVIDWFIKTCGNGNEVSFKDIEKYPKASYDNAQRFSKMSKTFVRLAKDAGKKRDFFETGLAKQKQKLYVVLLIPAAYLLISFMVAVTFNLSITFTIISSSPR